MRMIYLDHHATTPCDHRVVAAMLPYLSERFGNAASLAHAFGRAAREAVEAARVEVASLLQGSPREVIFTSGATESLNIAFKGLLGSRPERARVLVAATEHAAVRDCGRWAARQGRELELISVDAEGRVDLGDLEARLGRDPVSVALVAVMLANNEVGTVQPIAAIGALCERFQIPLLSDAVQGIGKVPFSVRWPGLVASAISAHKICGPKGIGALWIRARPPVALEPLFEGGGQERGLRPGTAPVPLIVAFGEACRLLRLEGAAEATRLAGLRDELWRRLSEGLGERVVRNTPRTDVLPNNLHVSFPGIESRVLMQHLPHLAFSTGSACQTESPTPSHVLTAMGLSDARIYSGVRFGLGRQTQACDIEEAAESLIGAIRLLG